GTATMTVIQGRKVGATGGTLVTWNDDATALLKPDGTPIWGNVGQASVGVRTVLFGHSYIDQEAGGASTDGSDTFDNWSNTGTVQWANWLMGKPLQIVKEFGRGSRRVLDMLPRYRGEVAPLNPALVIVSIGHNDLKGLYAGGPDQQPADDRQRQVPYLVEMMRAWLRDDVAHNTTVVLLGESPPGKSPTGVTTGANKYTSARFFRWNEALRRLAVEFNNVIYVPVERVVLDPADTTGVNVAGMFWDQVHPSITGAYKRGLMLKEHLERVVPVHCDILATSAADTFSNLKITTSAAPTFDGTSADLAFTNTDNNGRPVEIGDYVTVRIPGSDNRGLNGRYLVTDADDAGVTVATPGISGTATANADVSTSTNLLINPLFLTTTGGQQAPTGVVGSIVGNVPLGVTINSLPATHTVTVSTSAHTQRDGSAGFGNWMELDIVVAGSAGAASTFEVRLPVSNSSNYPATYDVERKLNIGQTVQFGCEIRQESASGGWAGFYTDAYVHVVDLDTGANAAYPKAFDVYRTTANTPLTSSHLFPVDDMTLTTMTPEMTLPVEANRVVLAANGRVWVSFVGDGSVTLKIARATFRVVDDPIEEGYLHLIT
ncbi:MAG: SGNH/GDSL hydrolase family protein, partial [Planctomycetales bacterium]|nr:SGNH/GDSL hydrolase family protein [Planctomycetales bacterium]